MLNCQRSITLQVLAVSAFTLVVFTAFSAPVYAQSPLVRMVSRVAQDVAVIAGMLSVVAVVVGGLTMAFSNGGNAGRLASVLFGIALATGATSVVAWFVG